MNSTTAVISLMFLFAFFHSSYSIRCYQCNSDYNDGCNETIDQTFLTDCPENSRCVSLVFYNNDTEYKTIKRGCELKEIVSYVLDICGSDCNENNTYNDEDEMQCNQCSSDLKKRNLQCEVIVGDTYLQPCSMNKTCYTMTGIDSGGYSASIMRGCIFESIELISQRHCDGDACNAYIA